MSEFQSLADLAKNADAVAFLVALLFALYKRWLRFGSDCDAREAAYRETIAGLQEDLKERDDEARRKDERHEGLFDEYRARMWRGEGLDPDRGRGEGGVDR